MALTHDQFIKHGLGHYGSAPVKASTTIYDGGMVGLTSGYARAFVAGDTFIGHCAQGMINTVATDGACDVRILDGIYKLQVTVPSVAVTDVQALVYATDDGTYSLTGGVGTPVGRVVRYVAANTAVVQFDTTGVIQSAIYSAGGTNTVTLKAYDVDATAWVDAVKVSGHATVPTVAIAPAGTSLGFFGKTPATQAANIVACATNETSGSNIAPVVVSLLAAVKSFGLIATN